MSVLPSAIAAPVTWAACLLLAAVLVRDWVLSQTDRLKARVEHLRIREQVLSQARMPLGLRLRTLYEERARQDVWRPWPQIAGLAAMSGLMTAAIATPLAVVSTRLVTGDKVFGVFTLFRDLPEGGERMARAVLVVLVFAALVRCYPVIDAWLKRKVAEVGSRSFAGVILAQCTLVPSFALFYLLGLTPAFVIVLTIAGFAAGLEYQSRQRGQDSPTELAAHLVLYLIFCALILLIGIAMVLLRDADPGISATVLLVGLLLPLASATGDFVAILALRGVTRQVARNWPGLWGLWPPLALVTAATALAVAVFLAALVPAIWLYGLIGPLKYALPADGVTLGLLANPAFGWPIWALAAVKALPLIDLLLRTLALCVTQRSAALQKSIGLLADRAPPDATAAMLIRAHSIGWIAVGLLVTVPLVALLLWQA